METRTPRERSGEVTRAVFDTNVLISGRISNQGPPRELLHHWIASDFELVTSQGILFELQQVLMRAKFRRYLSYEAALDYVSWIGDKAEVSEELPASVVQGATPDPDDDYLTGVVIRGRAEVLVSGDPHLFNLKTIREDERVIARVLTPREFLDELE